MKKFKLAVFISGNGSNLQALINASKSSDCPFKIELVFSNNPNAFGNKKNDKFNKFKSMSDENIQMLIHQHSTKRFNRYEDLEK